MPDLASVHHHSFDLHSVRTVPDSHVWTNLHDHPTADPSGRDIIPVIDLSIPDASSLIGRACEEWGVFQVLGHGISLPLLEKLDSQVRRLFSLPVERKMKAARAAGALSGYGLAPLSSFFSKYMWSEGFTVAGSSIDHARNLWPDQDPSLFCDIMEEYSREVEALAKRLVQMMLSSLELTREEAKGCTTIRDFRDISAVLQLNWYPACPDPERAMGLAAHTDSGLLTLLYQSSISTGLQVLSSEGGKARWVAVPPLPGALVVNIGDLAHILSNGRYRSILHRAVVNRTAPRLSAAYICGPRADVMISPVTRPAMYRNVTWPEYRGLKARFFDKALKSVRVKDHDEYDDDDKDDNLSETKNKLG